MRKMLSWLALLTWVTMPALRAQEASPPLPSRTRPQSAPAIIGTRHIDRYDAITHLQQRVKENPKSLADWIILGELAHEVALDLQADQDIRYYRISREAYEKALALQPDQPGLKAAVQFALEHEANSQRFEEVRDRATQTYLEARRRDLAATQYMPTLPVYGVPVAPMTVATPGTPVTPATTSTPAVAATTPAPPPGPTNLAAPTAPPAAPVLPPSSATQAPERATANAIVAADRDPAITNAPAAQDDAANMGTQQFYSNAIPSYQTYYARGVPYTYQQYRSAYDPYGIVGTSATPPITEQRYYQQLPAYPGRQSGNPFR
jgi:hypothetical protein